MYFLGGCLGCSIRGLWSTIREIMKIKIEKSFKAAFNHFQEASNQHGDAPTAITTTAAGLHVLTGIIQDLFEEVEALRAEVKELQEGK